MNIELFASAKEVLGGLFVGILFGMLLQKGGVTRFSVIVNQFLLKDFTVMKIILTAIAIGSLGIYGLQVFLGEAKLIINPTTLFAALLGGGIFGVGMALLGYCPGTCVGALASGNRDIPFGLFGMVAGAAIYTEVYPWVTKEIKPLESLNQMTLVDYFHLSPWVFIVILLGIVGLMILMDKKLGKKHKAP